MICSINRLKEASHVLLFGVETAGEHMSPPQTLVTGHLPVEVQLLEQVFRDSQQAPFAYLLLGRIYRYRNRLNCIRYIPANIIKTMLFIVLAN